MKVKTNQKRYYETIKRNEKKLGKSLEKLISFRNGIIHARNSSLKNHKTNDNAVEKKKKKVIKNKPSFYSLSETQQLLKTTFITQKQILSTLSGLIEDIKSQQIDKIPQPKHIKYQTETRLQTEFESIEQTDQENQQSSEYERKKQIQPHYYFSSFEEEPPLTRNHGSKKHIKTVKNKEKGFKKTVKLRLTS